MGADRVFLRYVLARAQLAPAIAHIEQLFDKEDWREASDALRLFARQLGVAMSGSADIQVRIGTGWFSAMDNDDQQRFMGMVDTLVALAEIAFPRAVNNPHARPFEKMRVDALFRNLRGELSWLQDVMRDDDDEIAHGQFRLILTKGVTDPQEAIATLDKVSAIIKSKFPQVLYGKVFVRKDLRPKGTYDARPGEGGQVAGSYQASGDSITLSMYATPNRDSVATLIHEFGHRYHTRFLKGDDRDRFIRLSMFGDIKEAYFTLSERRQFADEYIAREKTFREADDDDNSPVWSQGPIELSEKAEAYFESFKGDDARAWWKANVSPLLRKFRDEKDDSVHDRLRDALSRSNASGNLRVVLNEGEYYPLHATPYGSTSWEENFAESFLCFCIGKALPKALQEFMAQL